MTKSRGKERTMEILAGVLIIGQFVLLAAFLVGVVSFVGLIAYDAFAAAAQDRRGRSPLRIGGGGFDLSRPCGLRARTVVRVVREGKLWPRVSCSPSLRSRTRYATLCTAAARSRAIPEGVARCATMAGDTRTTEEPQK
jgi:hypothetical protein